MKLIAKSLIKIANELDDRGHTDLANRLDKVIVAIANDDGMSMVDEGEGMSMADGGADMSVGSPSATTQPATPGAKAPSDSQAQQMLQVQKLFNAYVKAQEEAHGIPHADKIIPENGKVGDRRTWTAINLEFKWKPVADHKNYKQLIALLEKELNKVKLSTAKSQVALLTARRANEKAAMEYWDRIINMDYDPGDAANYKINTFDDLLNKIENLPPQRGQADELHSKAEELAWLAKEIKADPSRSNELVEWLKAYLESIKEEVEAEA